MKKHILVIAIAASMIPQSLLGARPGSRITWETVFDIGQAAAFTSIAFGKGPIRSETNSLFKYITVGNLIRALGMAYYRYG
jgi:hypothetical protein